MGSPRGPAKGDISAEVMHELHELRIETKAQAVTIAELTLALGKACAEVERGEACIARLHTERNHAQAEVATLTAEVAAYADSTARDAETLNRRKEEIGRLERLSSFLRSCVKSGEPWTETCEREWAEAHRG